MKNVLLLVLLLLLAFCTSRLQGERVEKIEQCESRCSQGLRCKVKPYLLFEQCKKLPDGMTRDVFRNTSISTVMRCDGVRLCSLHLRVSTHLQLKKHIHGIYMCTVSATMMEHCRIVTFSRTQKEKALDHQVNIQDDCLEVGIGQDVYVTLQTWPQFCNVAYSRAFHVPDCSNKDLQGNIPECTAAGRIDYEVDLERREVHIRVSEMLEDRDYHVRLCHKDYICTGTGAHVLLKKENPVKNVTLKYSKPVPCLCIEGWSVMTDASRVQVCPFKNRVEELWYGITFDPVEETLSWEASCQISAVISLCELQDQGVCQDLANSSQRYSKGMVTYSAVDPHPRLCMKFVTQTGAWIKCPFSNGNFPAWDLEVSEEDQPQLLVTSRVKTSLSLSVCSKTGASGCEDTQTIVVDVEKFKHVQPNLAMDLCTSGLCIKAKRVDVKYGVTTLYCQPSCPRSSSKPTDSDSKWQLMYFILPAMTLTTAVAVAAAVLTIVIIGYHAKRTIKAWGITCLPGHHTALFSPMTEEVNSKTELMSTAALDDRNSSERSQLRDSERSNLLNGVTKHLEV